MTEFQVKQDINYDADNLLPVGKIKNVPRFHDSGGTPIPVKPMQTEYDCKKCRRTRQAIGFTRSFWRFPE